MDADRAPRPALSKQTGSARRRAWPLTVRRARPDDREAVLSFATTTWDGWDYIPHAWPVWIEATDGVLLVGVADEGATDAAGEPLPPDRPLAIARVAMTGPREAWLEGIRVDPRVRGMDVATDLQVAELTVAASLGATVVRYATSQRNEGSHRLGARHGFEVLTSFRTYLWQESAGTDEDDDDEANAYDAAERARATDRRRRLLAALSGTGNVAPMDDAVAAVLWARLSADSTFRRGHALYEHRAWALQGLTEERFRAHLSRGEVVVPAGAAAPAPITGWAIAIVTGEALPSEDVSLHLGLLVGDGPVALDLASAIRRAAGESIRFRLPDDDAPLPGATAQDFATAGFVARDWTLDILGRPLDADHPPPPIDPARVSARA